jgi:SPX domain protein involved in polyphosphate accumulation
VLLLLLLLLLLLQGFVRSTTKYWVHAEDVGNVKYHVLQHSRLLLLLLQGFIRSTTKYWVRAEDVSNVKYHVLHAFLNTASAAAAAAGLCSLHDQVLGAC